MKPHVSCVEFHSSQPHAMKMELEGDHNLHESLMDFIIRNLDSSAKASIMCVCKEWNSLCTRPEYWDTLNMSEPEVSLTANDFVFLLQRAKGSVRLISTSR